MVRCRFPTESTMRTRGDSPRPALDLFAPTHPLPPPLLPQLDSVQLILSRPSPLSSLEISSTFLSRNDHGRDEDDDDSGEGGGGENE